jgi:4-hydroxybenzoate polyprenyltransferase
MISRNKLKSYIEIARIDKPIGIYLLLWPSVLGLLIAGTINEIKIIDLLIVIIGSILVRSCGCVINDISDYKIDKLVSRTVGRPLSNWSLKCL